MQYALFLQALSHIMYICNYIVIMLYLITAAVDFIPGRYGVTFTPGTVMASVDIPIVIDNITDEQTEQFSLVLYIDGKGYQSCLDRGSTFKATGTILSNFY